MVTWTKMTTPSEESWINQLISYHNKCCSLLNSVTYSMWSSIPIRNCFFILIFFSWDSFLTINNSTFLAKMSVLLHTFYSPKKLLIWEWTKCKKKLRKPLSQSQEATGIAVPHYITSSYLSFQWRTNAVPFLCTDQFDSKPFFRLAERLAPTDFLSPLHFAKSFLGSILFRHFLYKP